MTRMLKRAFDEVATDSFLAVHRDAPIDDEPVTDEDLAALREGLEDLASGRTLSQEEILQRFAGKT